MSMNALEIAAIVFELTALTGARLSRAHQPNESDCVLEWHAEGRDWVLLLSAGDDNSRLHLIERRPVNPKIPYGFASLLRARLSPARLLDIAVQPGERVVTFDFETAQESGDLANLRLVAELTGRHANVFLLDAAGVILGSLRANRSRNRRLTPGNVYDPVIPHDLPGDLINRLDPPQDELPFAFNRAAMRLFGEDAQEAERARRVVQTRRELARRLKKLSRAAAAVEADLKRAELAPLWRRYADLMQIHFASLTRGQTSIELEDIIAGEGTAIIELDPALAPKANIDRYYRMARKAERGQDSGLKRLEELEAERDRLTRLKEWLDEEPEAVERVREKCGIKETRAHADTHARQSAETRLPFRRFVSGSGFEIRVGRSARDNDALTLRHCRGEDFWLHAGGWAGSHVVVVMPRGRELDSETLLDAATLAAHYSKARSGPIEVMYTRGKNVRKVKKAPPGQVLVSGHKSLMIDVDAARLRRLMDSSE
jgi:predicted ribosome quality control (RQC) complex YloA/Tae2 family protein